MKRRKKNENEVEMKGKEKREVKNKKFGMKREKAIGKKLISK